MISNSIQNIITKYLTNQASIVELEMLAQWLDEPKNEKEFQQYIKINYLIDYNTKKFNAVRSEKELLNFISKDKKVFKLNRIKKIFKYAASIALLIAGVYFYDNYNTTPSIDYNPVASEKITLKMENGSVKVIDEDGKFEIQDPQGNIVGNQKGSALVYDTDNQIEKLVYNTLTVPNGKRFAVELSDGTKVNLNAGTSLRYPVKFIKGEDRLVFIESGEAFFDVAKDPKRPFIVNNTKVNVRVLGTQFNVSSYPEDETVTTVLVEGSVSLYASNSEYQSNSATLLKPGYKAAWDKKSNAVGVEKADVEMYTAWIAGKIILKHMSFNSILKKLERHYDVEIINNNASLGEEFITASFDIETIEQVFETINEIHPIVYTIKNNQIIIQNN